MTVVTEVTVVVTVMTVVTVVTIVTVMTVVTVVAKQLCTPNIARIAKSCPESWSVVKVFM